MQDVEHAIGQANLFRPAPEQKGGHRGDLTRLGHHTVATGQGRGNLPGEQVEGQVPRADASDDTQWLAQGVVDGAIAHGVAFTRELFGRGGIKAKVLFCTRNVHCGGQRDGLPVVPRFCFREHGRVLRHFVGQAGQNGPAVRRRPRPPFREGCARGLDGCLDVFGTGSGNAPVDLPCSRFHIVEPISAQGSLLDSSNQVEDVVLHRPTRSA